MARRTLNAASLTPAIRRRVVAAVGLAAALALAAVVGVGTLVQASVGCGTCHAMEPYAEAHAAASHSPLPCARCHAPDGARALVADGLRGVGWALGGLVGRTPAVTQVPDAPCRACHTARLRAPAVSRGIAVRHSDFISQPCGDCHSGSAHQVDGRFYRALEMDDCLGCHKSAATDTSTCDTCHVGEAERREGSTAWRSTHGTGWETAHGMGDLTTCDSCHTPSVCIGCHGVRIPHPVDWVVSHAEPAAGPSSAGCPTCHDQAWCVDCHGVEMPHPDSFLPEHGLIALDVGEERCATCHDPASCQDCHYRSSHPSVPGTGMGHGG